MKMNLPKGILFLLLLTIYQVLPAQTTPVKGSVKNEKGEALPGATITVKGKPTSTATDQNGDFTIQALPGATISISAVGYAPYEQKLNGRAQLNIVLQLKAAELNDVVVVGYGTQKKADLTGAVVAVTGSELNKRIATDPTQLLQGKLPGLSVTRGTGEAGNEALTLRVRGLGTNSSAGSSPSSSSTACPAASRRWTRRTSNR
ncbi:carboxypeptidase-like regulatory domain-containing protein [Puia sp. P3]|uniref:carboxypeptidase-like regulatory domain-containing protein n=1 Tax=Puia sp. P3 TaxID=3423952 RepID=UPI003D669D28